MDCWNFSINYILKNNNILYQESDFIFSKVFEWVTLLPKIGIVLLKYFHEVIIVHAHKEIFINLKEDEIPLLQEYSKYLEEFEKLWWIYSNDEINLEYIKNQLKKYDCIIPIKKWEWSHLVVLKKIDNISVTMIDNKKWEYNVKLDEFLDLIDLVNWKYLLLIGK